MCINAEVSLITFLSSSAMAGYLWYRNEIKTNDRPIAIWIFVIAMMQFFEFLMWSNMNNHSFVSKLSLVFILLQPLSLAIGLYVYNSYNQFIYNDIPFGKYLLWTIIIISGIKVLYTIYYVFIEKSNEIWKSEKGPNCHLVWYFMKNMKHLPFLIRPNILYLAPIVLSTLLIKPLFPLGLIFTMFGFITFHLTKYIYGMEWGSIWCWLINIMGLFAISSKYLLGL
jgi:hypothetical protein